VNKRPGQIRVTVDTGYCSFCDRTRNLRREERQLGALIRTVIACESCHRVLSSTIGVAADSPPAGGAAELEAPPALPEAAAKDEATPEPPRPVAAPKRKTAAAKPKAAGAKTTAPPSRNRPAK